MVTQVNMKNGARVFGRLDHSFWKSILRQEWTYAVVVAVGAGSADIVDAAYFCHEFGVSSHW